MEGSVTIATGRYLTTGMLWSGGGRVVAMLGNLALSVVVAHALSPADYGRFYVALSSVVIFAVIAGLGMDRGVVRAVALAQRRGGGRKAISRALRHCLEWAGIGAVALALVAAVLTLQPMLATGFGSGTVLVLVIAWMFMATLQMQLAESFRALGRIHWANVFGGVRSSGILNALLPCVVMLVLWRFGWLDLRSAAAVMLVTACVIGGAAALKLRGLLRTLPESSTSVVTTVSMHADSMHRGGMLRIGISLWFASVVTVLHSQGLLWIAAALESPPEVARIAAAQRVVLILIAPTAIVNAVLPPLIAALWEQKQTRKLQRVTQAVAAAAAIPSLVVFAMLAVGGPLLLGSLFGDFYKLAYVPMLMLSLGQIMNIVTGAWQEVLAMTGHGKTLTWVNLLGLLAFVLLSSVVVGTFPAFGVAGAWATSIVVTNILGLWLTWRVTGVTSMAWVRQEEIANVLNRRFGRSYS